MTDPDLPHLPHLWWGKGGARRGISPATPHPSRGVGWGGAVGGADFKVWQQEDIDDDMDG